MAPKNGSTSGKRRKDLKVLPTQDADVDEHRFDSSKPQFRKTTQKASKVVLDDRFASVLTDPRFQLTTADKYGRKQNGKSQDGKEKLSDFYTIQSESEQQDSKVSAAKRPSDEDDHETRPAADDDKATITKKKPSKKKNPEKNDEDDPASRIAYLTALSRGEVDVSSSDDDDDDPVDDDNSDDGDDDSEVDDGDTAGVLDPSSKDDDPVEMTMEESPYMAVLNMDWSHVRAVDIFTILSSFSPPGAVKRVQVYPSDFGMERMQKEALFGPVDVWKKKKTPKVGDPAGDQVEPYQSDNEDDEMEEESENDDDESIENEDDDFDAPEHADSSNGAERARGKSDFDPEKLRRYEASRLKYYFAIVEFATPQHADIAYKQVDGMEFEHSSAAIDLRSIPVDGLDDVCKNRQLRDEAAMIPSNYVPPEFVVNALQQSNVQCTWDMGNQDRETLLTKYTSGQTWGQVTEGDDLKAYVASDNSSDDEDDDDGENAKGSNMRKMLGLDSDDDGDRVDNNESNEDDAADDDDEDDSEDSHNGDDTGGNRQASFIPGESDLAAKLRDKLSSKSTTSADLSLTPWEKYLDKRKQKKREKRAASREKRKQVANVRKGNEVSKKELTNSEDDDDFFVEASDRSSDVRGEESERTFSAPKAGLDTLVDDNDEDDERDFNMRGLERIEKNKDKKLHGARKRKEEKLTANVTGTDFRVDTSDERFKAVLEGTDDRFGIDRTDPNFKETAAMREILAEQSRNRKKKRKNVRDATVSNGEGTQPSATSTALSVLAKRIKSKIT